MEAVKTIAFEICEQLGGAPDQVFVPVAGGGLLSAIWQGFREFRKLGRIDLLPKVNGVQSAGCPTVVRGVREGRPRQAEVSNTAIGALAAPFAPDGNLALRSILDSGGWGFDPRDEEILAAQSLLAVREGIFAEPIGAASVAGVIRARQEKRVGSEDRIVCLIRTRLQGSAVGGFSHRRRPFPRSRWTNSWRRRFQPLGCSSLLHPLLISASTSETEQHAM
jgi:threonine synthase